MKKRNSLILLSTLLVATVLLSSYLLQDDKKKPSKVYQVGNAKVAVWENKQADGTIKKSFKVEKSYKTANGEYKNTNYFYESELLELKEVIDKAINAELTEQK
jgi:hypothetical protein